MPRISGTKVQTAQTRAPKRTATKPQAGERPKTVAARNGWAPKTTPKKPASGGERPASTTPKKPATGGERPSAKPKPATGRTTTPKPAPRVSANEGGSVGGSEAGGGGGRGGGQISAPVRPYVASTGGGE